MSARLSEPSGLDDLLLYKLSRLLAELFPLVCDINRGLLAPLSPREVLEGAIPAQQQAETMVQQAQLRKADRRRGSRPRLEMG